MSKSTRNKIAWGIFAFLAVGVGLYPLLYWLAPEPVGLLLSKSMELLESQVWNIGFYGHITFGGVALLTGWSQFSKKIRSKKLKLHRNLGKIYVGSVVLSGLCAVYLGFYATGGLVAAAGFIGLGLVWLYTTLKAYTAIRTKDISLHQGMMIYSYAACFAAVTLRIWLPFLTMVFGEFLIAYRLVAWLSWVPNIIFAHFWVRRKGLNII